MKKEKENILIEVNGLKKYFPIKKGIFQQTVGQIKAVDNINFKIKFGETLGLVGESGCGKSTAGKSILRLIEPTEGNIKYNINKSLQLDQKFSKIDITKLTSKDLRKLRQEIQYIFQDPYSSFNPRKNVESILSEPFIIHGFIHNNDLKTKMAIKSPIILAVTITKTFMALILGLLILSKPIPVILSIGSKSP